MAAVDQTTSTPADGSAAAAGHLQAAEMSPVPLMAGAGVEGRNGAPAHAPHASRGRAAERAAAVMTSSAGGQARPPLPDCAVPQPEWFRTCAARLVTISFAPPSAHPLQAAPYRIPYLPPLPIAAGPPALPLQAGCSSSTRAARWA
eukprot:scaffold344_cov113-Isochrysis_galbana.AAC.2